MAFRPLLAATFEGGDDYNKLQFPMLASPKLDGIRVICHQEMGAISRSCKSIPNKFVQEFLSDPRLRFLDGEILVGEPTDPSVFNKTQSAVMTQAGEPDFQYYVFDTYGPFYTCPFSTRLDEAASIVNSLPDHLRDRVRLLGHTEINTVEEFDAFEGDCVDNGYEGAMYRKKFGPYKFNRSTLKEGILLKAKRFEDAEGIVTGWDPLERNANTAFTDERGYTRRSSHQENKIVDDRRIGKLIVNVTSGKFCGVEVRVGSGFTDDQRLEIHANFAKYQGKTITFKYMPYGSKDAPRQPIFKGFRYD